MKEKITKNAWLRNFSASLLSEIVIAFIFMRIYNDQYIFWLTLLFIYIFYFLKWFFKQILCFVVFNLFEKEDLTSKIYQILLEEKFPPVYQYDEDSEISYFKSIVKDKNIDWGIRLKCLDFVSLEEISKHSGGRIYSGRINKCLEEAIKRYHYYLEDKELESTAGIRL